MELTKEQMDTVASICKQHNIAAAYLFGSFSRGTAGKQSDVDIAVLFDSEDLSLKESLKREGDVAVALQAIFHREVDLVDLGQVTSPLLKHRAVLRGQRIFNGNDKKRQQLERHVLREYEDTQHLRNIQNTIMERQIKEGTFGKPLISPFSQKDH